MHPNYPFENFCVKSNLTLCKITFKCKLQKIGGAGCTSFSPNNFVGGATALPVSRAYGWMT